MHPDSGGKVEQFCFNLPFVALVGKVWEDILGEAAVRSPSVSHVDVGMSCRSRFWFTVIQRNLVLSANLLFTAHWHWVHRGTYES